MSSRNWWAVFAAAALIGSVNQPDGFADTLYVDSGFSSLQIQVYDHETSTLISSAQAEGSDTTSLGGTMDVTLSGGYITFNSASISFDDQGSDMQPAIGGGSASAGTSLDPFPPSPGSDPANYGLYLTAYNDPGDPESGIALAAVAAIRGAVATLASDPIAVSDSAFDSTQVTLGLTAGSLDYNANGGDGTPLGHGSSSIEGYSALNSASGGGAGVFEGVTFVQLPVSIDVYDSVRGIDIVLTGQIGATDVAPMMMARVPEPSTIILVILGCLGLVPFARRRTK